MNVTKRISELLQVLTTGIPEREFCVQLAFLTAVVGEPFYLYGRSGSGKSLVINRLMAAFKNAKVLRIGKRELEMPNRLDSFDMIIFQSLNVTDEKAKANLHIAFDDRANASLIVSGDIRPEAALNRADITDRITLIVALPDNISPEALCDLLKTPGDVTATYVPRGLAVSSEEKTQWNEEIRKIALSEDTLHIIAEMAKVCQKECIYVPIRKWLALSNIMKAAAFFNGRTETRITDTFFLGTPIWGRSTANASITESYLDIVRKRILKDIPDILENPYNPDDLIARINQVLKTSNNLYETKLFNDEQCVCYRINIGGEPTPLYVPIRYVESNGRFHPLNELRQEEKHVFCDFHGTSSCTISIDANVKSVGLRNYSVRGNNASFQMKFEEFGTLPTHILRENDPEILEQKKQKLADIRQEIQQAAEHQARNLQILRDIFNHIKESRDDLFSLKDFYKKAQDEVSVLFHNTKEIIEKIKEAHDLVVSQSKNLEQ